MKMIAEGVRYDTDKARLIGRATSKTPYKTDFSYWEAGLYATARSGRYFLAGIGGPMTLFRRNAAGGGWTGGEAIKPLSVEDAQEWAEHHLPVDVVEAEFGAGIED